MTPQARQESCDIRCQLTSVSGDCFPTFPKTINGGSPPWEPHGGPHGGAHGGPWGATGGLHGPHRSYWRPPWGFWKAKTFPKLSTNFWIPQVSNGAFIEVRKGPPWAPWGAHCPCLLWEPHGGPLGGHMWGPMGVPLGGEGGLHGEAHVGTWVAPWTTQEDPSLFLEVPTGSLPGGSWLAPWEPSGEPHRGREPSLSFASSAQVSFAQKFKPRATAFGDSITAAMHSISNHRFKWFQCRSQIRCRATLVAL